MTSKNLVSIFLTPNFGLWNFTITRWFRISKTYPVPNNLCLTTSPSLISGPRDGSISPQRSNFFFRSSGISSKNLLGGFILVCHRVILLCACERKRTSFALVIATYISLRSSSRSFGSTMAFDNGKMLSSIPATNTTGNSNHLLECTVISFTASMSPCSFS